MESVGKRRGAAGASALFVLLFGCAQPGPPHLSKQEYEEVFAQAIAKSFAASRANNVCLPQMFWTNAGYIEIQEPAAGTPPAGLAAQLAALNEAGLVYRSTSERTVNNRTTTYVRYTRTAKGNQYFANGRFCYGHAQLRKILKWRGPAVLGEYAIAWVYYTAKAANVAEWAEDPGIQQAFPDVRSTLHAETDKVRQALIDLTSEGWEVNEWSRVLQ